MSDHTTPKPVGSEKDVVCEHGTAMDVHCCGCHSGFLFDVQSCRCLSGDDIRDPKEAPPSGVSDPMEKSPEYKQGYRDAARGAFVCKVRRHGLTDPPQDCDWPFCGCDPHADRVIAALEESGMLVEKSAATEIAQLSASLRKAESERDELAGILAWTHDALGGHAVSDFALTFGAVRLAVDVRAENTRLTRELQKATAELQELSGIVAGLREVAEGKFRSLADIRADRRLDEKRQKDNGK